MKNAALAPMICGCFLKKVKLGSVLDDWLDNVSLADGELHAD
jgi:hypothetical protein